MKKPVYGLWFIVYSLILLTTIATWAEPVSFRELLDESDKYDGQTITFQGEVIGDIMQRKDGAWLNVRDETGAIGVFCAKDEAGKIKYTGSYKFSGDIISVRGAFRHSCPRHGGDTDIHAEKITVIQEGKQILHPLEPQKVKAGATLAAIALALAIIHLIIRRLR